MAKLPRLGGAAMVIRKLKWRHSWGEAIGVEKMFNLDQYQGHEACQHRSEGMQARTYPHLQID